LDATAAPEPQVQPVDVEMKFVERRFFEDAQNLLHVLEAQRRLFIVAHRASSVSRRLASKYTWRLIRIGRRVSLGEIDCNRVSRP
jgi:hypothetical protein